VSRALSFYAVVYTLYGKGKEMVKKFAAFISVLLISFIFTFAAGAQIDAQTPKEAEVSKSLQQGLVVFLCLHDAKEPNLDKIKSDITDVAINFRGAIGAVYVSGDDKKEDKLREKLKVLPNETVVFIIQPSGRVVAKIPGADISKTSLMKTVVSSCGGGGCGSGGGGCG